MRGWTLVAVLAGSVAATAACEGNGNIFQVAARGEGQVVVSVSEGTTPTYAWSGGRARSLAVRSASGDVSWQIEALDQQDGFASPVRHGVVPAGARVVAQSRPLEPGVVHTAVIVSVSGVQGIRTFTPATLTAP